MLTLNPAFLIALTVRALAVHTLDLTVLTLAVSLCALSPKPNKKRVVVAQSEMIERDQNRKDDSLCSLALRDLHLDITFAS